MGILIVINTHFSNIVGLKALTTNILIATSYLQGFERHTLIMMKLLTNPFFIVNINSYNLLDRILVTYGFSLELLRSLFIGKEYS